jgi:hypothetical protein
MSYNQLETESIIDNFFRPTERKLEKIINDENEVINEETMNYIYQMTELKKSKKKPVIINTPINDIFKDKNMRDIIFEYKRESMINDEKDFESLIQKGKDTNHTEDYKYIGDLKIGDRYGDRYDGVYQIVKITAKSAIALPVEYIKIDVEIPDKYNKFGYDRSYKKYTDKLGTKKQTKRKTTVVTFLNQDYEICFFSKFFFN